MTEHVANKLKTKKGKNFGTEEERQLCQSFLAISQDPVGTGQKSATFWERIMGHYNHHRPVGSGLRPWRSLESKWAVIKADVAKFSAVYSQVKATEDSGSDEADTIKKAHHLFRSKNGKNRSFTFVHCWEMLRHVPKWATYRDVDKVVSTKRKYMDQGSGSVQHVVSVEDASSPVS